MSEELLARLIENYHRLQAEGKKPQPEDFRDEAGEHYDEFVALIEQEKLFDQAPLTSGRNGSAMLGRL